MSSDYHGQLRPEMLAFLPERRRVALDVGCGEARFAASIPGATELWGVEPNMQAAAAARSRLSHLLDRPFEAAKRDLPRRYFDVIVCNDVIEHMPDHDGFLEDVKDLLTDGGALVASIPNVRHYANLFDVVVGGDWEYRDMGVLDRTHRRFFTERSLRRTLQQHGFRIEVLEGIFGGIAFGWNRWMLARWLAANGAIALSLGRFRDIRYQRFAVRATLPA